jgi:DNA-binding winged helix-turn-helix (wHTH) protein
MLRRTAVSIQALFMASEGSGSQIRFGECRLNVSTRQVFRSGVEVHLSPKAFELLKLLVERRPRAISKAEAHAAIWPDTFVSDASLARLVTDIRSAIGDDAREPRFVRTVHGFGYAFAGVATGAPAGAPPLRGSGVTCWLLLGSRDIQLAEGENLIGRDPASTVWLDSPRVSRHHSRIVLTGGDAILEDLDSKNGTYLRGARLVEPARLQHGDVIQVGLFPLTFRVTRVDMSTETELE